MSNFNKKSASKGTKVAKFILLIFLCILLIAAIAFEFILSKLDKITYDDGSHDETIETIPSVPVVSETDPVIDPTELVTESPETEPPESVEMNGLTMETAPSFSSGDLFKNADVKNILLVGTDEFSEGFSKTSRGDVNILVSINKSENTVKLVSFSRGIAMPMLDGPYKGKYEWLTNVHRWAGQIGRAHV